MVVNVVFSRGVVALRARGKGVRFRRRDERQREPKVEMMASSEMDVSPARLLRVSFGSATGGGRQNADAKTPSARECRARAPGGKERRSLTVEFTYVRGIGESAARITCSARASRRGVRRVTKKKNKRRARIERDRKKAGGARAGEAGHAHPSQSLLNHQRPHPHQCPAPPAFCMPSRRIKSTHSSEPKKVLPVRTTNDSAPHTAGLPLKTRSMPRSSITPARNW